MSRRDGAVLAGITAGWLASQAPKAWSFRAALRDPERAQTERLRAFLRANADTAYGRAHSYGSIASAAEFQSRVPIVDYAALQPWIERSASGVVAVLTREPVRAFEQTSGSTANRKLIPFTNSFLAEVSAATGPWLFDLYRRRPALLGTRSYWSVSPAAREPERTRGGAPIGFEDDTSYFGPLGRWALGKMMAVPGSVARIRSIEQWRDATARYLLAAADLGLISVWSPSFLTLLMEYLERELPRLLQGLERRRRSEIEARCSVSGFSGPALWPRLALISCWTSGAAARLLPALRRFFPGVEIQGKGLLATEGVVSIPLSGSAAEGAVLAVGSHFLEFVDLERPSAAPRQAHELEIGGSYSPLLTTGGGLARYRLSDAVRCIGRVARTPVIRFEGRTDLTSDLCGEKLSVQLVEQALRRHGEALRFALVAPAAHAPLRYRLYAESDLADAPLAEVAARIEQQFAKSFHYRYCRDLGQLAPLELVRVRDGARRYEAAMLARGLRLGDLKPAVLDLRAGWDEAFGVG